MHKKYLSSFFFFFFFFFFQLVDSLSSGLKSELKLKDGEKAETVCDVKTEEVDPISQRQTYMLQYVMEMQQEIDNRLNKIREQIDSKCDLFSIWPIENLNRFI